MVLTPCARMQRPGKYFASRRVATQAEANAVESGVAPLAPPDGELEGEVLEEERQVDVADEGALE
jgi:hypothetical protein